MNMPILTQFGNSEQSMTSLEIAELVEKRHDNVKRTIESLVKANIISNPQIEDGIKSANGVIPKVYVFTGGKGKRDSIIVVAQLCPEFTARLVDRWAELEAQARQPQKPAELSRMEILQIAMESEKENIALRGELAIATPKAQALDTIADTSQTYCLRECAKTIGIKESELIDLLLLKKWIYREPSSSPKKKGKLQPYAQYVTCGVFINRASPVMADGFGVERVHLNMQVTAFGLTRITGLVNKNKVGAA